MLGRLFDALLAGLVRGGFALIRALGPDRASALGGTVARRLGPLTPWHRLALDNIRHAFPERDAAWQRATAREAWDNLGRTACEYVHMETIWDWQGQPTPGGRIEIDEASRLRFLGLRDDGAPALVFAAHLANWELPAIAAARHGMDAAVLFRTPNNARVARTILGLRRLSMGELIPAGLTAPLRLVRALERGAHVGMLVDQRFGRGPRVPFLGRPAAANPLLAELARRFDCPVLGCHAVRTRGARFRLVLDAPLDLPRDAEGRIDVAGATAAINAAVERWVRDHPGQWLWMHRRWR
jgi:KDO2-lipid IV(A) lauroyltransferase